MKARALNGGIECIKTSKIVIYIYEIICLKALKDNPGAYSKAYVVLGGEGGTMRNFYVEGNLMNIYEEPNI
jgi:hypothetical protein